MKQTFTVESINASAKKGRIKTPVAEVRVNELGFENDAHAGPWHRQITLLAMEEIESVTGVGRYLKPGEFAENITTRGVDLGQVAILDRFTFGEVDLEVTQIGKECHTGCAIFQEIGKCIMPKQGVFTRVLHGGIIKAGMTGEYIQRELVIRIITLSDRAVAGIYEDLSGPKIVEGVRAYYEGKRDHLKICTLLIPDDADALRNALEGAAAEGVDLVITTGSTGVGARDIAPETTVAFCDRQIPGIMEYFRVTFGAKKRNALISRGIAGLHGKMAVINFPGSVKACEEYTREFMPVWEHMRLMIHGIDSHK